MVREAQALLATKMPEVLIRSQRPSLYSQVREFVQFRELLYFLVWKNLKVRYAQAVLGTAWALLQPVLTALLIALLLGRFAGMPTEGAPPFVFYLTAMVPWTSFSNALTTSATSLVSNQPSLMKVYFPRLCFLVSAVLSALVDLVIPLLLLLAVTAYYERIELSVDTVIGIPLLVLIATVAATGLGVGLSALNLQYRDVNHVLPFVVQMLFSRRPSSTRQDSCQAAGAMFFFAEPSCAGHRRIARRPASLTPHIVGSNWRRSCFGPSDARRRCDLFRAGAASLRGRCLMSAKPIVIEAKNLGKLYKISSSTRSTTLREAISSGAAAVWNWAGRSVLHNAQNQDELWAAHDVSFSVAQGETVGLIGANGSGKSTLLKIVSRIVTPTVGQVRIKGRVGALLEVGTGFHPELTGRENIFLNGALIGMSAADIRRKFDEIVEFSGMEAFLDLPIKRYSSGMAMRLAFSVAAHLEPDVLIIDEVLAVGDADFQRKCLERMDQVSKSGCTVFFVSHYLGAVQRLCDRTLLLEHGRLTLDGPTNKVVGQYLASASVRGASGEWVELPPLRPALAQARS